MSSPHAHDDHIHPEPQGFIWKYVFSRDHKVIAKQYLFTTFFFLLVGGALAMLIRYQLAFPEKGKIAPETYIMLVTMHGTIMVFFVVAPIFVGAFSNFLIPLMIGARDVAFPTLNMLSYWFFFCSGIAILAGFFVEGGHASAGWTSYPPLSAFAQAVPGSGLGQDMWILGLTLMVVSSAMGSLNFIVTIINMRSPGMSWFRLPLFIWSVFIVSILLLLSFPVLAAGVFMLSFDRHLGTFFFRPEGLVISGQAFEGGGGNVLLWQHLFWYLGHPEVYVLILPGMGIASELLSTFSRKPIFGYRAMVYAMSAIAGLGFIVWGHHMFQAGMNPYVGMAFMVSTMLIAMPSGVKVFNWLGTLWGGAIQFKVPMLYALAFISQFVVGGLSGIFMAATPVDIHIHDTYFIVAHFHYVVFGGSLFAIFGGLTYWFPKMFGRMMNDFWGKVHFFLTFVSFNCVFFPMHILGAGGHMRRIADPTVYEFLQPLQGINVFITMSAFVLGLAQLIFLANFFLSMFWGKKAEENPWRANTLEWTIPSPPKYYNFEKIPIVHHGPYEYSAPSGNGKDWLAQTETSVASSPPGH